MLLQHARHHDDDHDDHGGLHRETQGPFPGDGSNSANVLNQTGVVRSDIRSSFAGLSGYQLELATITGVVSAGMTATLTIAV